MPLARSDSAGDRWPRTQSRGISRACAGKSHVHGLSSPPSRCVPVSSSTGSEAVSSERRARTSIEPVSLGFEADEVMRRRNPPTIVSSNDCSRSFPGGSAIIGWASQSALTAPEPAVAGQPLRSGRPAHARHRFRRYPDRRRRRPAGAVKRAINGRVAA